MKTTAAHRETVRRWKENNPEREKANRERAKLRRKKRRKISDHLCECGCGGFTYLAPSSQRGVKAGEPQRFLKGHSTRKSIHYIKEDRGYRTPCWIWQLSKHPQGYGKIVVDRKSWRAHRWYYTKYVGVIPDGYVVDHLCSMSSCVNPNHLEAVTPQTNQWRALAVRLGLSHEQRQSLEAWMTATLSSEQIQKFRESFTWHPAK